MTRAAIYARYSSDRQSERSAEDQARLCQERADREGWVVVGIYPDLALSGATRDRPGLNALLGQLDGIDVVIAESIDRLSRDQEDIAAIYKRLRFAAVRLVTLSEGEVGPMHIGMGGTMAALYLEQLAEKTRRGQVGRVAAGRIPGGLSYGYELANTIDERGTVERGRRRIADEQAEVVRRIFADYLTGISPRAIAEALNRAGVASPSGGKWGASTILGNRRRQTGILSNPLYDGRIVYNRQRFEKHPVTRRRIAKPNPESEWRQAVDEDLRIVARDQWAEVQRRLGLLSDVPATHQRRPKRLLSGILRCGCCDAPYVVLGNERWGCSGQRRGLGCRNVATIVNAELERRVLGSLRERMLTPDLVAEFVREFHRVLAHDRKQRLSSRSVLERRHARAEAQIQRLIDAIADGRGAPTELLHRVRILSVERDTLAAQLADIAAEPVVAMHPGIAEVYRRQLADLSQALRADDASAAEAREIIRGLVDVVIATPRADRPGVDLDLRGSLAAILALTQKSPTPREGFGRTLSLVAGTGFEPVTFRL